MLVALKETGKIALIALFISSFVWTWFELVLEYTLDNNEVELLVLGSLVLAVVVLLLLRKIRSALRSRHEAPNPRRARARRDR